MEQRLPTDILLAIIESGKPSDPRAILPPSHETTRTLLAWTRVCRATHPFAARLLRKHYVHVDSGTRLQSLLSTLRREDAEQPRRLEGPTQMYLGPFPDADYNSIPRPLDDPLLAAGVRDLLIMVAPTLRRLVVDMPLRSLYPEHDTQNVRRPLRDGFSALVHLEEFVSVSDELYLNVEDAGRGEAEIWATCWPNLRRLSLYNVDMDPDTRFLRHLAGVPRLQSVVFPRPDGLVAWEDAELWRHPNSAIDVKKAWLEALAANVRDGGLERPRDLSITFVNMRQMTPVFEAHAESWEELDPEGRVCVRVCEVVAPSLAVTTERAVQDVQDFVKSQATAGTLFDADLGERVDDSSYVRRRVLVEGEPVQIE